MYLKCLVISQVLLVLVAEESWALTCLSCYDFKCPEIPDCPGGKVLEACACCLECAKQKNEACGGPYDVYGMCDKGLECAGNLMGGFCVERKAAEVKDRKQKRKNKGRKRVIDSSRAQRVPTREAGPRDAMLTQGGATERNAFFK